MTYNFQVMLALQSNEEHNYKSNPKSKDIEKSSLRDIHIKVVSATYFTSVVQRATRSIIRRFLTFFCLYILSKAWIKLLCFTFYTISDKSK